MQQYVVERTREHANRLETKGVHDGVNLPVAEMTGAEQPAASMAVGRPRAILAFELEGGAHCSRSKRAELQQLEEHATEVHEHRAVDRGTFRARALRECEREVRIGDAAVHTIEHVETEADERAARSHERHRQGSYKRAHDEHCPIFQAISHAAGPR